ncbi:hypothetical protein [Anaerococcus marasmi]|uniref:hypothetical protein n=1 Tax=Anaerococcus marasmi TaxID=2057797 RepID=UPI000CF86AC9|nr:hypothetical protein [Anaerococcus marasmi]
MTKNKRGVILKLTERIIKKVNRLGYATPGDACEIVDMVDKIEDYLMAYKAYKIEFKEDIRHLRYLIWSMASTGADTQNYYEEKVKENLEILKDELEVWTLKEVEE